MFIIILLKIVKDNYTFALASMKLFSNIGFYVGLLIGASVATVGFYVMSEKQEEKPDKKTPQLAESDKIDPVPYTPEIYKEDAVEAYKDYNDQPEDKVVMQEVITIGDSMEFDSVRVEELDTASFSSDSLVGVEDELILVRKDVLMRTLKFELPLTDTVERTLIDTLAEDLNIVESIEHSSYELELWESPIGYSGYKTSGNKIMVFGIDTATFIDLKRTENGLDLHVGNQIYLIEKKSEFVALKKKEE